MNDCVLEISMHKCGGGEQGAITGRKTLALHMTKSSSIPSITVVPEQHKE